ncbi:MAG: endopeptidase La [Firmicutes bacterium]|nr:endopeptidase La [Bacillota bacterium]
MEEIQENNITENEIPIDENVIESPVRFSMITLRGTVAFPGQTINFDLSRDKSVLALNHALEENREVFLVTQKHAATKNPSPKDIYRIGVKARVRQIIRLHNDAVRVTAHALERMEIDEYISVLPFYEVTLKDMLLETSDSVKLDAIKRSVNDEINKYCKLDIKIPPDISASLRFPDAYGFVGLVGAYVFKKEEDKQRLLAAADEYVQYEEILSYLIKENEILTTEREISQKLRKKLDQNQRDYHLREQIKVIQEELGAEKGTTLDELEEYRQSAKSKKLPQAALEKVNKEIVKIERMNSSSPEAAVSRSYIEWILDLPWYKKAKETEDLKEAQRILDEDHYGIEKVKERIVEYLAVTHLTKELKGPILCFVGPPGVGKTSIVSSIARASGRKLVTMSLGGIKDEAEIRGHRRTYIGSLPGRILSGMKQAETVNPVFLLDEIDKMSSDYRGDPSAALLEVLDPNQNKAFKDHYLELEYDLSKVMFVTTANTLDSIPLPLLDRMEIIELSGYTYEEKLQIAKKYLLPKQVKANGLKENGADISDENLKKVIASYTRESGVRNLEREISTICRKIAVKIVNGDIPKEEVYTVTDSDIKEFLGVVKYRGDKQNEKDEVGTATGLAWTSVGGTTLSIEVVLIPNGKGDMVLTGSLGEVMKESCQTALSLVKSRAAKFKIDFEKFKTHDIHIHFPEGATPKDGPSAGISIATALLSAFSNRKVKKTVAMTGEVTLRGKVLPIGGLKEKSLAAFRTGIKTLIIPEDNRKDAIDIPAEVTDVIDIVYSDSIDTVFANSFAN